MILQMKRTDLRQWLVADAPDQGLEDVLQVLIGRLRHGMLLISSEILLTEVLQPSIGIYSLPVYLVLLGFQLPQEVIEVVGPHVNVDAFVLFPVTVFIGSHGYAPTIPSLSVFIYRPEATSPAVVLRTISCPSSFS